MDIAKMKDAYFMDLENETLEQAHFVDGQRFHFCVKELKGVKRLKNKKWMKAIEENIEYNVYPDCFYKKMSDYVKWVREGGGDEWFAPEV